MVVTRRAGRIAPQILSHCSGDIKNVGDDCPVIAGKVGSTKDAEEPLGGGYMGTLELVHGLPGGARLLSETCCVCHCLSGVVNFGLRVVVYF